MDNKILEGINLNKRFGGLVVIRDLNFHVNKGEILGLIGPNGAGKTTLFNLISGVYQLDSGILRFKGKDIGRLKPYQICKLGISRTFQLMRPFLNQTALQNALVGVLYGRNEKINMVTARIEASKALDLVGLSSYKDTPISSMTTIQRKQVEMARAMATNPALLMLDEPLAGLNSVEIKKFLSIIQRMREMGMTVLMIEHSIKAVMSISDRILVLHQGQMVAEGNPGEISGSKTVQDVYLGEDYVTVA